MKPIISIDLKSLLFPNEKEAALRDIKLEINQGDFIGITGGAASGKSLLLHAITSAAPKFYPCKINGTIKVANRNVEEIPLCEMADYVGYMMQEPQNQMISRVVYDELAFGVSNLNLSNEEIDSRVREIMAFLSMNDLAHRYTDALSGGQAQKVVLGSILTLKTPVLLLDQPAAELDPKTSSELYQHLSRLNKENNITTMVVMDKSGEVLKYANQVIVMENGTIKDYLKTEDYINKYLEKEKVGRPIELKVDHETDIVKLMGASHMYKGGIIGCRPIDFTLKKGDFTVVIGLNGSGKSTMLKIIEGLLKPTEGAVELFGIPITKKNIGELRRRTGFLFQNPDDQIFCSTIKEEIGYVLKNKDCSKEEKDKKIQDALAFIGLSGQEEVHPQKLSRGQRQLLALGSVIINEPELIIADEPTSGLDEIQSRLVMEKLTRLSQQGKTILLVTHELSVAKNFANRVIVMNQHELVMDFKADQMECFTDDLIKMELMEGDRL